MVYLVFLARVVRLHNSFKYFSSEMTPQAARSIGTTMCMIVNSIVCCRFRSHSITLSLGTNCTEFRLSTRTKLDRSMGVPCVYNTDSISHSNIIFLYA
jgi:hypothetical protein